MRSERTESRGRHLALPQKIAQRRLSAAWAVSLIVLLSLGAAMSCVAAGFTYARVSDDQRIAAQHKALRSAVSEFRALFANGSEVDPRFIRMIEQGAGLKDLRFDAEPADAPRDMQPVANADGRLLGFLTWQAGTPMTDMMKEFAPLLAGGVFGIVFFIGISVWQLRRSRVALVETELKVREAAERDPLTGFANESKMSRLLDFALAQRAERGTVTYALLGLGSLEAVTESYGQQGLDEIVSVVAMRLREVLPENVACARVSDRVFGLLWDDDRDVTTFLHGMIDLATRPHWIDTVVKIRACCGFARAPGDANGRDELMRRAELALRTAEKESGVVVAFDHALDASASEMHFIRRELPRALAAQALDVHYQPIVAADSGRIIGVEALLRWTHKDRGAISPAQFVAMAEQMGLMVDLGAFVLRRALRDAKRWPSLYLSVNLSPLQARDHGIVDIVRNALRESGVAHTRLVLEITEGVLIDNPEEMLKRIAELRAIGVKIALDDFGSGYSSLGYLQRFPFDKLKVDRTFVSALGRSANAAVIIQAVVALGRALGVTVVVEGVETEEQRVLLRLSGCDEMQGFLFARPASADAIAELLRNKSATSAVA